MNVQTFKVLNGDELIADIVHVGDQFIIAENIMILQLMQHPETGKTIRAFGDWPALAKPGQVIKVPITAVLAMPVDAHEDLHRNFVSNVTGLELPEPTPKILLS